MKTIFFGAVAIVLEIIAIIGLYYGLHGSIDHYEAQLEANSALLANYGFVNNNVEDLTQSSDLINREVALLAAINESRPDIPYMLGSIAKNLPGSVWLKEFTLKDDGAEIIGFSRSKTDLSKFVKSLKAAKVFEKMKIKKLKNTTLLKSKVLVFEMSATSH